LVVGTRLAFRWMRGRRIIDVIEPGRDGRRVEHLFCASWLAAVSSVGPLGKPRRMWAGVVQ
jgi:hypothetical protein